MLIDPFYVFAYAIPAFMLGMLLGMSYGTLWIAGWWLKWQLNKSKQKIKLLH